MHSKKRVQLTRLGPAQHECVSGQNVNANLCSSPGTDTEPRMRSIRLNIELTDSNKDVFPYIDYMVEIRKEVARIKQECGDRPIIVVNVEDSDEDTVESQGTARRQGRTEKTRGKKKKRTRLRVDNFEELASGYDECDDFVDNSAHLCEVDEVPADVSPPLGGFYVNKGQIETEEKKGEPVKVKRKKRKSLTSGGK